MWAEEGGCGRGSSISKELPQFVKPSLRITVLLIPRKPASSDSIIRFAILKSWLQSPHWIQSGPRWSFSSTNWITDQSHSTTTWSYPSTCRERLILSSGNEYFRIHACQNPRIFCSYLRFLIYFQKIMCMCSIPWKAMQRLKLWKEGREPWCTGFNVHKNIPANSNHQKWISKEIINYVYPRSIVCRSRDEFGEEARLVLLSETFLVLFFTLIHIFLKELLNFIGSLDHT